MQWFEVSKVGLAKLLERRGRAFAVMELLQNAWDTAARRVTVEFHAVPGQPKAKIVVTDDDPHGFKNLDHAFTLFAESEKKGDATKRGRFNFGEKLVLALCEEAWIRSTTGMVCFDRYGRHIRHQRTLAGSEFVGMMKMTHAEHAEALAALRAILPPESCETILNGEPLTRRTPLHAFEASLPTEIADADGNLRRSTRKTTVQVYEPHDGETPSLYEMGIPVVETGDKYHLNIEQKIPLTFDRDNVPPAYLRQLRLLVVNEMHARLTTTDANTAWVREATSHPECSEEAVRRAVDLRFGDKRVIYDPSDPEANKIAVSEGYTVIHGGMLNATEWENVRRSGAALPAGKVTPSPKPYSPDGDPLRIVPRAGWTNNMERTAQHAQVLARELLGTEVEVRIANDMGLNAAATFGPSRVLVLNLVRLGHAWFDQVGSDAQHRLLIHEYGHFYSGDHLSSEYHEALCGLGARLARLALRRPDLFLREER